MDDEISGGPCGDSMTDVSADLFEVLGLLVGSSTTPWLTD